MTPTLNADGWRELLSNLLERCDTGSSEEERRALRAVVRERRNWRPDRQQTPASAALGRQAEEIVQLLEGAARVLRPREAQLLDDLVAGRKPVEDLGASYAPVRLHRRGGR